MWSGAGLEPQVEALPIGRHAWVEERWHLSGAEDIAPRIAALAPGIERKHLVARLHLSGSCRWPRRVTLRRLLEDGLAHEIRWLDLDLADLMTRPTETDLSEIDAHGELRDAAERLRAMAGGWRHRGPAGRAALERLYVELMRAQRGSEA